MNTVIIRGKYLYFIKTNDILKTDRTESLVGAYFHSMKCLLEEMGKLPMNCSIDDEIELFNKKEQERTKMITTVLKEVLITDIKEQVMNELGDESPYICLECNGELVYSWVANTGEIEEEGTVRMEMVKKVLDAIGWYGDIKIDQVIRFIEVIGTERNVPVKFAGLDEKNACIHPNVLFDYLRTVINVDNPRMSIAERVSGEYADLLGSMSCGYCIGNELCLKVQESEDDTSRFIYMQEGGHTYYEIPIDYLLGEMLEWIARTIDMTNVSDVPNSSKFQGIESFRHVIKQSSQEHFGYGMKDLGEKEVDLSVHTIETIKRTDYGAGVKNDELGIYIDMDKGKIRICRSVISHVFDESFSDMDKLENLMRCKLAMVSAFELAHKSLGGCDNVVVGDNGNPYVDKILSEGFDMIDTADIIKKLKGSHVSSGETFSFR